MEWGSYTLSQWLFLRSVGIIYLIAFASLILQVKGLFGSKGILPIHLYLETYRERLGKARAYYIPTLFWWNSSDRSLIAACIAGMSCSLFLILGILPVLQLTLLWILYLSFVSVGQDFLRFQWDSLLLETGFISIFFATSTPPSPVLILLIWLLLFRLMIASGWCKWASGDASWRTLTALNYHYETQPLPTRWGWWAHQLPTWFQKGSVAAVFALELLVPLGIFGFREVQIATFFLLAFLQVLIMLTGNYCFFNLLALILSLPLLDDQFLQPLARFATIPITPSSVSLEAFSATVGMGLIALNILYVVNMFSPRIYCRSLLSKIAPFEIINSYGLFAVMTTNRCEIIVEGSLDGVNWLPYEFCWKPQNVATPPRWVQPYHPRLDWQMWFAALSSYYVTPWFRKFLSRLLEGSPDVLALMKSNPFPDQPPRYIRALAYDTHFTDIATRRKTGRWWTFTYEGPYSPTLEKRSEER